MFWCWGGMLWCGACTNVVLSLASIMISKFVFLRSYVPELFKLDTVTMTADWWSVGSLFYEMLMGEVCFDRYLSIKEV